MTMRAFCKPGGSGPTLYCLFFLACILTPGGGWAAEVSAAVAANFLLPLRSIAPAFEKETGHRVRIVSGSTGKLYAQIKQGAPFDVFFAADAKRPELLVEEGLAVSGSRFTYAVGRLVLWSADAALVSGDAERTLKNGSFRHLAVANPKTAPYGRAAQEALAKLGLWEGMRPLLVRGENISQTFQFVVSGNAELGFVALSQVNSGKFANKGSRWAVPPKWHAPILQDAVLLSRAKNNPAALALLRFLAGPVAKKRITRFGYGFE